jgi:four helix bundle protein
MVLVEQVYELTARFPSSERYGLVQQLRRAAVSIPSNIAEGHARQTGHYSHHVSMAIGSEAELQTQLELARRLKLADPKSAAAVMQSTSEVGRMLRGLLASIELRRTKRPDP